MYNDVVMRWIHSNIRFVLDHTACTADDPYGYVKFCAINTAAETMESRHFPDNYCRSLYHQLFDLAMHDADEAVKLLQAWKDYVIELIGGYEYG